MGKALTKGGLIGGIIVYLWMMVSWMFLPWHCSTLKSFRNEESVAEAIFNNAEKDGIYVVPNICNAAEIQEQTEGPLIFTSVTHMKSYWSFRPYLISLIIQIVAAAIITYLVGQTNFSYTGKVFFITLIGLVAAIIGELHNWTWWSFPFSYVMANVIDIVVGWFLAGLAIAGLIKHKPNRG